MRSRMVRRPLACWRSTASAPPSSLASRLRRSISSTSGDQDMVAADDSAGARIGKPWVEAVLGYTALHETPEAHHRTRNPVAARGFWTGELAPIARRRRDR